MPISAAAVVLAMLLAACGGATGDNKDEGAASNSACKHPTKVGFVYVGPITDGGWTTSHDNARKNAEKELADKYGEDCVSTSYVENVAYTEEMTQIHEQSVADGYDMIVDTGTSGDLFKSVCEAHPEVACLTTDGQLPIGDNVVAYYAAHWETAYLLGMAAGLLTETDELGYVGGFPVPTIIANANAMALGCQSVNPDCTMRVTFIDSWYDPKKATEAAQALADVGADFLYNTVDDPSAIVVAEDKGIWAAGAYLGQEEAGPDAYVSADVWDFSGFYSSQIESVINGTFSGGRLEFPDMADGGLTLDDWGQNVPDDVRAKVEEEAAKIGAGESPFVGPIVDQNGQEQVAAGETLDSDFLYGQWDWFVEGIQGSVN